LRGVRFGAMKPPMTSGEVFCVLVVLGVVAFQAWVTLRVARTGVYERAQKLAQAKLIWLVPVLGAALVMSVLHQEESAQRPRSSETRDRS
jgi:cytochrome bd-type quinol oxidase subunit 2